MRCQGNAWQCKRAMRQRPCACKATASWQTPCHPPRGRQQTPRACMYVLPRSRNPPSPGQDQKRWSSVPFAGGACAAGAPASAPAACCSPLSTADAGAPRKGRLKRRMNSAAELDLLHHAPPLLSSFTAGASAQQKDAAECAARNEGVQYDQTSERQASGRSTPQHSSHHQSMWGSRAESRGELLSQSTPPTPCTASFTLTAQAGAGAPRGLRIRRRRRALRRRRRALLPKGEGLHQEALLLHLRAHARVGIALHACKPEGTRVHEPARCLGARRAACSEPARRAAGARGPRRSAAAAARALGAMLPPPSTAGRRAGAARLVAQRDDRAGRGLGQHAAQPGRQQGTQGRRRQPAAQVVDLEHQRDQALAAGAPAGEARLQRRDGEARGEHLPPGSPQR